jgi:hypothetical protein
VTPSELDAGPDSPPGERPVSAPAPPASAPHYAPLETADGSWTLVHPVHGEACHSRAGAWLESLERYAVPCELAARAAALRVALGGARPLRLADIGTGAGWGLAAALFAVEGAGAAREVDTFELDLELVRAGLALPAAPPAAAPWITAVRAALAEALEAPPGAPVPLAGPGRPDRGTPDRGLVGILRLHPGDARRTLPALRGGPRWDAVFLDGFSPGGGGRDGALWDPALLRAIAERMLPEALLSTFTSAFAVRAALAAAGLGVGRGPAVGAKRSGTLASHRAPLPALRPAVEARLARAARPESTPEEESGAGRA